MENIHYIEKTLILDKFICQINPSKGPKKDLIVSSLPSSSAASAPKTGNRASKLGSKPNSYTGIIS